jgi:hypothetical protein
MKKLLLFSSLLITFTAANAQNVGVSTSGSFTPTERLHVDGNAKIDNALIVNPQTVAAAATITVATQTTAINITAVGGAQANAITYSPTPTAGQIMYIFNADGDPATFAGTTIPAGGFGTFLYLSGNWRVVSNGTNGGPSGTAGGDLTGTYPNPTIAANAVGSSEITDGTVGTADITDASITGTDIAAGSIPNADLTNSSLTVTGSGGLTGGGSVALGGSTTITMPNVGTAGTYGSATQVPVIATDAQGRVTGVTNTAITGLLASGSTNYLPKWSSATALSATSLTYDNGTSVGIGTNLPSANSKLHVLGDVMIGTGTNTYFSTPAGAGAITLNGSTSGSMVRMVVNDGSGTFNIFQNAYYDGSNWKYNATAEATKITSSAGVLTFAVAPSGAAGSNASWTTGLTINNNGTVRLNTYTTNGIVRTTSANGTLSSSGGNIDLTTEVTGILPVANGGTGSSAQNWVDLTTTQTAAGAKTWSNNASFSANVGIGAAASTPRLYIVDAGNANVASGTFSVLANNLTQGVGIGYQGISAIGSNATQDLSLNSKSTGNVLLSTNGTTRVTVGGTGTVQLNAYTTNGIVRTTASNGTLSSTGGNINLTSEVTGVLPVANGGTGSATQNWVDLTTTQTVAGAKTWSNNAVFSGTVTVNNTLQADKYVVQNNVDGTNAKGIWMWNAGDANWGIYMGQSGAGKSLANGTATTGAGGFAQHAIRIRTTNSSTQGLIYENSAEQLNFSVRGSDGMGYFRGNLGIGVTSPTYALTIATGNAGAIAIDNQATLLAKNSGGSYETFMWPRWSDNIMYMNFGSGGFNLRNNGSTSAMFITNGNLVGIGTTSPSYQLHVNGYEYVEQGTMFRCSSCGSSSAFQGSSDWGTLTVQGRVLSTNSNMHLSPPSGFSVVINDDYRAAGGTASAGANLIVEDGRQSINTSISTLYRLNAYDQQLTATGDGQATIYGYRTRDSQNDGSSYTGYGTNSAIQGYNYWGDLYTFGVTGMSYNDFTRTGGVLGGQVGGGYWTALGYKASNSSSYGLYSTATGYNGTTNTNGGYTASENKYDGIGSGSLGGIIGSYTRGMIMGHVAMGTMFASYNLGNEYTSGYQADIVTTPTKRVAAYSMTSTDVKVFDNGVASIEGTSVFVAFDQNYADMLGETPTVTISPIGNSASLYIAKMDKNGFTVASNSSATAQFTWIAVGKRIDADVKAGLPTDIADRNFDNNMKDVMFDENNLDQSAKPIWWDGSKVRFDAIPQTPINKVEPKQFPNSTPNN